MTSRISFSNVLKEDRKRRIWPFVLFAMLCFLITASFELNLESYIGRELAFSRIQENIERLTRNGMVGVYLIFAGIGACLFGFQGFGWLTKKEQVDFYHSQPMKREKRFAVIYLNGMIMCLVPMILHMAAYTFLIGIRGYLNLAVVQNLLMNLAIFLIAFLMMYHLVILAVMLCGNMIVSFMLGGTIFVYPTVVKYLILAFFESYFDTYAYQYSSAAQWLGYLSPIERVYRAGNYMIRGQWADVGICLSILAVMAALMLAAAFYLYKKRPSEAAGNALAYHFAGDFIRFLIVIPGGMFFGIMFASLSVMSGIFWLYFGTLVGALLTHGFMEVIFHFDIKAALGKKVQLAVSAVLVLFLVSIFCFDIFGYDSYIPEENQVKELSYYFNMGEGYSDYLAIGEDGVPVCEPGESYIYREEYQMEASKTKEISPILSLIHAYMEDGRQTSPDEAVIQMIVHYKMKNGRDVYRSYLMSKEFVEEFYEPVYNTEQGRKVIYPYWNLSGEKVREVSVYSPFMTEQKIELTQEEIKDLVECYKKDIREQSLHELLTAQYIGDARLYYDVPGEKNSSIEISLNITKNHENMITFFQNRDISLTLSKDHYEVTEVIIFNPYAAEETMEHPFWQGREQVSLTKEQMEELIPVMVPEDKYSYEANYYLYGYMTVRNKATGEKKQVYYNISGENTPAYMRVEE